MNVGPMISTPPDPSLRRLAADFVQADLEFAKWVALITMAIDHYGKIVDGSVFVQTHAIGRVSFPLFAAIIGIRLATRPSLDAHYLRYLIPWAIVSQPVFVLVGRHWYDGNILVTLALGVAATHIIRRWAEKPELTQIVIFAAILAVSVFVDYGILGVAMVPVMALVTTHRFFASAAAVGPFGLAANINTSPPLLIVPDFAALVASPILLFSLWAKIRLPRLPTQVFYAFYPAHLLALHIYDLYF